MAFQAVKVAEMAVSSLYRAVSRNRRRGLGRTAIPIWWNSALLGMTRNDATPYLASYTCYLTLPLSPAYHTFTSHPIMTRSTNAAPRDNLSSMPQSRSRKPAVTDSANVKQKKGQNWTKTDLDVDFSLKEHTEVRVDKPDVGEASGRRGRHSVEDTSTTQPRPQVQLVDLLVPPRKSRKGKGAYTPQPCFIHTSELCCRRWRLWSRASHPFGYRAGR